MQLGKRALLLFGACLFALPAARAEDPLSVRQQILQRMSEGRAALLQGDARRAVESLCWAARRALNSHDAAWYCGKARLAARDAEGAVKALELATEIEPKHLATWIDLGDAYLASGRAERARPAYFKALEIRKDYSPAWDGLARLAQSMGKEDEALELYAKALEANPADARVRLHRSQLHLAAGRLDQAVADITEAARLRPEDGEVQLGLALAHLRAKAVDPALAAARRAAAALPKDARPPALMAEIMLNADAVAEAEEMARAALALDANNARGRLVLGQVLGRQGRIDDAITTLVPPDPKALDPDELRPIAEAKRAWEARRDERARLETDAAAPDPPFAALLGLAEIRLTTGDLAGAAALGERAAPLALDAAAQRRVALVLGRSGRLRVAADLFAQVDAAGAATPADLVNLGVLLERTGDATGAGEAYRRAAAAPAVAADAHAGLARLALARGDRAAAAAALRAYLDSSPPAGLAARARRALERLEPGSADPGAPATGAVPR